MTPEETLYISIGQNLKGAEQSQMFGKPCFKLGRKAFMSFYHNDIVFKLTGDMHEEALSLDGTKAFDPSGKKSAYERMGSGAVSLQRLMAEICGSGDKICQADMSPNNFKTNYMTH